MYPFFEIFSFKMPLFGTMIVTGFFMGLFTAFYRKKRLGLKTDDILYTMIYAAIGALVGGKIVYAITMIGPVIEKWDQITAIMTNPLELVIIFGGGLVFYGGIIGAVIMAFIYLRRYKLPLFEYLDTIMVSVPLIHAIGRIGCFLGGCCYGMEAPPPWGVYFVNSLDEHMRHVSVLPTQLYESGFNLVVYGILLFIFYRTTYIRARVTGIYFASYAVGRFILEFFRGDTIRGAFGSLSTSQWICIPMFVLGLWFVFDKKELLVKFLSGKEQALPEEFEATVSPVETTVGR